MVDQLNLVSRAQCRPKERAGRVIGMLRRSRPRSRPRSRSRSAQQRYLDEGIPACLRTREASRLATSQLFLMNGCSWPEADISSASALGLVLFSAFDPKRTLLRSREQIPVTCTDLHQA